MPPVQQTKEEFEQAFTQLANQTENFTSIPEDLLSRNPRAIRTLRMILGLGQQEMSKIISKSYATISQYERGLIKRIPIKEAKRQLAVLKQQLPQDINFQTAIANFEKFSEIAKGGDLTKFRLVEKKEEVFDPEEVLFNILKQSRVDFETNKELNTSIGSLNFNFVINDKIVIEIINSLEETNAEAKGFRILKLKEENPEIKTVAVVPQEVTESYLLKLCDFDYIVFFDEITELSFL